MCDIRQKVEEKKSGHRQAYRGCNRLMPKSNKTCLESRLSHVVFHEYAWFVAPLCDGRHDFDSVATANFIPATILGAGSLAISVSISTMGWLAFLSS